MDKEQLKGLAEMRSVASMGEWYSWDSPVGLGIFFGILMVASAVLIVAIRYPW